MVNSEKEKVLSPFPLCFLTEYVFLVFRQAEDTRKIHLELADPIRKRLCKHADNRKAVQRQAIPQRLQSR